MTLELNSFLESVYRIQILSLFFFDGRGNLDIYSQCKLERSLHS